MKYSVSFFFTLGDLDPVFAVDLSLAVFHFCSSLFVKFRNR
jgi:hypothetical protein